VSTFRRTRTKLGTDMCNFSLYQNRTWYRPVYVSSYQNKNRYRAASTFRRTRRKPGTGPCLRFVLSEKTGTGLCLRFIVPKQKQVRACVYVSSYQNKATYKHVSTFRRTRTKPGTCLSTFRRARTKPGTGLCLHFIIPEHNQLQSFVYVQERTTKP
jgi:hypothetical protein